MLEARFGMLGMATLLPCFILENGRFCLSGSVHPKNTNATYEIREGANMSSSV